MARGADLGDGIEAEVDALVGEKIAPAERDNFVELAKRDHDLFEKMVENRPKLGLTGQRTVKPNEGDTPPADPAGESLAQKALEDADAAE